MKKWVKVLLIILLVLVVLLAAVYIRFREEIRILYKALTTDPEVLAAELSDMREKQESTQIQVIVKPVTIEQSDDLLDGKTTPEDVKAQMGLNDYTGEASTKEDLVNQCIAELYAYKIDVMGYLGGLKQEALEQWNALSKKQRTKTKKMEIATAGLNKCYSYEVQVDGHVEEILDVYRGKMTAIGEDTAPIDILWNQYCEEKEAEKSYYLGKYMN